MNDRDKFIIRAALLYAQANLDDLNEAFTADEPSDNLISVNGERSEPITEDEVEQLLMTLQ